MCNEAKVVLKSHTHFNLYGKIFHKIFSYLLKSIKIDRLRVRIILKMIENHNEAKVLWLAHYGMKFRNA